MVRISRLLIPCVMVGIGLSLSGCGTLMPKSLPSCDGQARRPINPSLWNAEISQGPLGAESQRKIDARKDPTASEVMALNGVGFGFLKGPTLSYRTSFDRCGIAG